MEEAIMKFWEEQNIFEKSITQRDGAEDFVFYDGPPFATGLPHFGHFVPGTLKRYYSPLSVHERRNVSNAVSAGTATGCLLSMKWKRSWVFPVKPKLKSSALPNSTNPAVLSFSGLQNEWRQVITRMGRWVDFDNDYKTMETDYMESIWWVVKSLWDKGLVYKGHYILPTCPPLFHPPLSNHELNLGGYKDVNDPAITIKFKQAGRRQYLVPGLDDDPLDPDLQSGPDTG